jgi:nitrite reductase/ring-hydroxylating ferredoxin subunit
VSAPSPPPTAGPISVFDIEDARPLTVVDGRCRLCPVEELPVGARKVFAIGGARGIGVFNIAGYYYAIRNICPHKGAPLCYGRLRPHVIGPEVGDFAFEREGEILKCPWHQWEFDLTTGWSLYAPRMRVRTYPVTVEDGYLVLHLDGEGA